MAEDKKKGPAKEKNATNEAANWDQRVRNELDSSLKWNADWGEMYSNGIPFDYEGRIKYLEQEVSKCSKEASRIPKYGVGSPFREIGRKDYRRKKLFYTKPDED